MDKLELILQKMNSMECKMDSMERKIDSMEHKMDSMEHRMDSMERKMDSMQEDISQVKDNILKLNVRMDSEVCFGIKIIADGHADLERKINQALLDSKSKEHLHVKLLCLETEIHQIKRNCPQCA
ncbi:MAG: hypothetical protein IJ374_05725 [Lachnospiraceae bacterium]|nr:hypothetical protein [Lachnospiraceae bacterium]